MISLGFPLFAFIMYAHGMQYFDKNMPTTVNRILTTLLMSIITIMAYVWQGYDYTGYVGIYILASFALWIWPGWISYIAAAVGSTPTVPRWQGAVEMTLRNALIAPLIAGLCYLTKSSYWPCAGILLLGLPYYINGCALKGNLARFQVVAGHAMVGVIIWGILVAALS